MEPLFKSRRFEQAEPLRQKSLYMQIINLLESEQMWHKPASYDFHNWRASNEFRLNLLHHLTGKEPTRDHPITCDGEVDGWAYTYLYIGFRQASYLGFSGNCEEYYDILEDIVSLLENAMKITSKVKVNLKSRWFEFTDCTAEEDWNSDGTGIILTAAQEERCIWMHNNESWSIILYPSWFYSYLTAQSNGWEWFDPIRNDSRFQGYVGRIHSLIVTRKKQK